MNRKPLYCISCSQLLTDRFFYAHPVGTDRWDPLCENCTHKERNRATVTYDFFHPAVIPPDTETEEVTE